MRLLAGLCALASVLSVANAGMMDDNRPAPQMGGVGVEQPEGVHTRMNVKVNIRAVIQRILSRYPARYAMFREMIQNANDAGASMIKFEFRASCDPDGDSLWSSLKGNLVSGNACLVITDDGSGFNEAAWTRLRTIASGNPDTEKVGGFGVGFYSVFSISEAPVVRSRGTQFEFSWESDKLVTEITKDKTFDDSNGGEGRPGTVISLPLNNVTAVHDEHNTPYFLAYLVRALSFTDSLTQIMVKGLPFYQTFVVDKTLQDSATVSGHYEAGGLSQANIFQYEETLLRRTYVIRSLTKISNGETRSSNGTFAMAQGNAKCLYKGVDNDFTRYVKRKTGKPDMPSKVKVQLLYQLGGHNIESQEECRKHFVECAMAPSRYSDAGRIYVGFETQQTTGTSFHVCAPFYATMDRESLEVGDNPLASFNADLLWLAGKFSRALYEAEVRRLVAEAPQPVLLGTPAAAELSHRMTQLVRIFTLGDSTPAPGVGQVLTGAFFFAELLARGSMAKRGDGGGKVVSTLPVLCVKPRRPEADAAIHHEGSAEARLEVCDVSEALLAPELGKAIGKNKKKKGQKEGQAAANATAVAAKESYEWRYLAQPLFAPEVASAVPEFVAMLLAADSGRGYLRKMTATELVDGIAKLQPMEAEFGAECLHWLLLLGRSGKLESLTLRHLRQALGNMRICLGPVSADPASAEAQCSESLGSATKLASAKYVGMPLPADTLPAKFSALISAALPDDAISSVFGLRPLQFDDWWVFATGANGDAEQRFRDDQSKLAARLSTVLGQVVAAGAPAKNGKDGGVQPAGGAHEKALRFLSFLSAPLVRVQLSAAHLGVLRAVHAVPCTDGELRPAPLVHFKEAMAGQDAGQSLPTLHEDATVAAGERPAIPHRFLKQLGVRSRVHIQSLVEGLFAAASATGGVGIGVAAGASEAAVRTISAMVADLSDDEWAFLKAKPFLLDHAAVRGAQRKAAAAAKASGTEAGGAAEKVAAALQFEPAEPELLYLPRADLRAMGLPTVHCPPLNDTKTLRAKDRETEAGLKKLLLRIGVIEEPSLDVVLAVAAEQAPEGAADDAKAAAAARREAALEFLAVRGPLLFMSSLGGGAARALTQRFLPTDDPEQPLATPNECFAQPSPSALRMPAVLEAYSSLAQLFDVRREPSVELAVARALQVLGPNTTALRGLAGEAVVGSAEGRLAHEVRANPGTKDRAEVLEHLAKRLRRAKRSVSERLVGLLKRAPIVAEAALAVSADSADAGVSDAAQLEAAAQADAVFVFSKPADALVSSSEALTLALNAHSELNAAPGAAGDAKKRRTKKISPKRKAVMAKALAQAESVAASLVGKRLVSDFGEAANSFLKLLGAPAVDEKPGLFFGRVLLRRASQLHALHTAAPQEDGGNSAFCAALTTFARHVHTKTLVALRASKVVLARDRKAGMRPRAVRPSQCYFHDGSVDRELLRLTSPRYLCPALLPVRCQAAYERLGSKSLTDAIEYRPHGIADAAADPLAVATTSETERFEGLVLTRKALVKFALGQKLKYATQASEDAAEAAAEGGAGDGDAGDEAGFGGRASDVLDGAYAVMADVRVRHVAALQRELWFEGRMLEVQAASALLEPEAHGGRILVRAPGNASEVAAAAVGGAEAAESATAPPAELSHISFQLATAVVARSWDLLSFGGKGSFGLVRDFAQTVHFVLKNDLATLESMHYPVAELVLKDGAEVDDERAKRRAALDVVEARRNRAAKKAREALEQAKKDAATKEEEAAALRKAAREREVVRAEAEAEARAAQLRKAEAEAQKEAEAAKEQAAVAARKKKDKAEAESRRLLLEAEREAALEATRAEEEAASAQWKAHQKAAADAEAELEAAQARAAESRRAADAKASKARADAAKASLAAKEAAAAGNKNAAKEAEAAAASARHEADAAEAKAKATAAEADAELAEAEARTEAGAEEARQAAAKEADKVRRTALADVDAKLASKQKEATQQAEEARLAAAREEGDARKAANAAAAQKREVAAQEVAAAAAAAKAAAAKRQEEAKADAQKVAAAAADARKAAAKTAASAQAEEGAAGAKRRLAEAEAEAERVRERAARKAKAAKRRAEEAEQAQTEAIQEAAKKAAADADDSVSPYADEEEEEARAVKKIEAREAAQRKLEALREETHERQQAAEAEAAETVKRAEAAAAAAREALEAEKEKVGATAAKAAEEAEKQAAAESEASSKAAEVEAQKAEKEEERRLDEAEKAEEEALAEMKAAEKKEKAEEEAEHRARETAEEGDARARRKAEREAAEARRAAEAKAAAARRLAEEDAAHVASLKRKEIAAAAEAKRRAQAAAAEKASAEAGVAAAKLEAEAAASASKIDDEAERAAALAKAKADAKAMNDKAKEDAAQVDARAAEEAEKAKKQGAKEAEAQARKAKKQAAKAEGEQRKAAAEQQKRAEAEARVRAQKQAEDRAAGKSQLPDHGAKTPGNDQQTTPNNGFDETTPTKNAPDLSEQNDNVDEDVLRERELAEAEARKLNQEGPGAAAAAAKAAADAADKAKAAEAAAAAKADAETSAAEKDSKAEARRAEAMEEESEREAALLKAKKAEEKRVRIAKKHAAKAKKKAEFAAQKQEKQEKVQAAAAKARQDEETSAQKKKDGQQKLVAKLKFRSSFELYELPDPAADGGDGGHFGPQRALDEPSTLDEYLTRRLNTVGATLRQIFFMAAPSRAAAESMALFRKFKELQVELLLVFAEAGGALPMQQYVLSNVQRYQDWQVIPADQADLAEVTAEVEKARTQRRKQHKQQQQQQRDRAHDNGHHDDSEDDGDHRKSDEPTKPPVDCKVSAWRVWSPCTKSCGTGSKTRSRKIERQPKHDGRPCPSLEQVRACGKKACPPEQFANGVLEMTADSEFAISEHPAKAVHYGFMRRSQPHYMQAKARLEVAAAQHGARVLHVMVDADGPYARLLSYFGLGGFGLGALPLYLIADNSGNAGMRQYRYTDNPEPSLEAFVAGFLRGTLKRHVKSEPVPPSRQTLNHLRVVVGGSFGAEVLDEDEDVLLLVHAPHEGAGAVRVMEKVAKALRSTAKKLVIARLNGVDNDIDHSSVAIRSFPSFFFFGAQDKQSGVATEAPFQHLDALAAMRWLARRVQATGAGAWTGARELSDGALRELLDPPLRNGVVRYTSATEEQVHSDERRVHHLLFVDEESHAYEGARAALEHSAKQFGDQLLHLLVPHTQHNVLRYFELGEAQLPAAVIANMTTGSIANYRFDGPHYHKDTAVAFVADFFAGELRRHIRSAPQPQWGSKESGVLVAVGSTFKKLCVNTGSDVLALLYSQGNEPALQQVEAVATELEGVPGVAVVKMAMGQNELDLELDGVEAPPMLLAFRPSGSTPAVLSAADLQQLRYTDVLQWFQQHASKPLKKAEKKAPKAEPQAPPSTPPRDSATAAKGTGQKSLSAKAKAKMLAWLGGLFEGKVTTVKASAPGTMFMPAIVTSAADVEANGAMNTALTLEINPAHGIIRKLNRMRKNKPDLAVIVAEQVLDNAMISAGLMTNPDLERMNSLMSAYLAAAGRQ